MTGDFPWDEWPDAVPDPDRWVYHYTTRETAIGNILPTGQLRFSLFEWMTDPRESKKWRFGGRIPRERKVEYDHEETSDRLNELAKSHAKLLCMTCDAEQAPQSPNERYQRGFAHSRMWSEYGGRHSGVCLIFDRSKLHEAITARLGDENLYCGRVTYEEWTPIHGEAFTIDHEHLDEYGVDRALLGYIRTYADEYFFHKNLDWEHEVEYRWVYLGNTPTPEFVPFGDALAGICVGVNYSSKPVLADAALLHAAEHYGIGSTPRVIWQNGRVSIVHERRPSDPPGSGFQADQILWGGERTRELEVPPLPEESPENALGDTRA